MNDTNHVIETFAKPGWEKPRSVTAFVFRFVNFDIDVDCTIFLKRTFWRAGFWDML